MVLAFLDVHPIKTSKQCMMFIPTWCSTINANFNYHRCSCLTLEVTHIVK